MFKSDADFWYQNSTDGGKTFTMIGLVGGDSANAITAKRVGNGDKPDRDFRFIKAS